MPAFDIAFHQQPPISAQAVRTLYASAILHQTGPGCPLLSSGG